MIGIDNILESSQHCQNNRENSDVNQSKQKKNTRRDGLIKRVLKGIVLTREFLANPEEFLKKRDYERMFNNDIERMVFEIYYKQGLGRLALDFYRECVTVPWEATKQWTNYQIEAEREWNSESTNDKHLTQDFDEGHTKRVQKVNLEERWRI